MWVMSAILLYAAAAFLGHGLYLWKRRMLRELVLSFLVLGAGVLLHVLWAVRVELPSPFEWLNAMYRPVYEAIFPGARISS
ncbi:hypothetical protein [Paenibacillus mucilaginosus]|uniref:Uncharacterized protein n=3 Tax=Paenibacillus mucilaginosus TaxID=61624 RepID=H6N8X9_9BACL|nr:hypothetical protein [Paenibacillus mucilaginosus]AEI39466.1 hypothetical protein KNP414_00876 [Paenibacillus mucilaginosus KNP414]AFC27725.1 hypothetical protein PM3016_771 [Paenibacillus mucilaginosus 3016]AFH59880.1 hypothetical protein B2K_03930 [Paenibacillus mucilaginosus K02]MCG7214705.1 hypothetical protein [Paenibacillus mucilaginosus]WDM28435.1 hypothetical protein KCX80_04105 [Paenibacillus mucilaginosus]